MNVLINEKTLIITCKLCTGEYEKALGKEAARHKELIKEEIMSKQGKQRQRVKGAVKVPQGFFNV